jgi:hypothetical protein
VFFKNYNLLYTILLSLDCLSSSVVFFLINGVSKRPSASYLNNFQPVLLARVSICAPSLSLVDVLLYDRCFTGSYRIDSKNQHCTFEDEWTRGQRPSKGMYIPWWSLVHTLKQPGADPGFQVRGAYLKNCAERREARKFWGYFVWKITILRQKNHIFSNFRGGAPGAPPPGSAPGYNKSGWPGIVWIHWLARANFFPLTFVSCCLVSTSSAIVAAILSKDYKYLDWSGIVYMFEGFSYCNLFLNVQLLLRNQQKIS